MHRSNFPVAVRSTLNDLAFDVKKTTLLKSADQQFILRAPKFFKSHSGVKKATGFNINTMHSEAGITPRGSQAAKDLAKQEHGGAMPGEAIYLDTARVSKSKQKKVSKANYLNRGHVKGRQNANRGRRASRVAAAVVAKRENKFLLEGGILFDVKSIRFGTGKTRRVNIRAVPVASYKKGRTVKLDKRPFVANAGKMSQQKANALYIKNAKKRFKTGRQ